MRQYKKRSEWQILVTQFLQSKENIKNFCINHNLKSRTFKKWYYKLNNKNNTYASSNKLTHIKSNFIKVPIPSSETIAVRLPNGITLEIKTRNLLMIIKELANAF